MRVRCRVERSEHLLCYTYTVDSMNGFISRGEDRFYPFLVSDHAFLLMQETARRVCIQIPGIITHKTEWLEKNDSRIWGGSYKVCF